DIGPAQHIFAAQEQSSLVIGLPAQANAGAVFTIAVAVGKGRGVIVDLAGAETEYQINPAAEILAVLGVSVAQGLAGQGVAPRSALFIVTADVVMAEQPFRRPKRGVETGGQPRADAFNAGALIELLAGTKAAYAVLV